ncbi:MAG: hypothetical protein BMS9Abin23_0644 [Thermodesulfobacteriota bacterium]|nr:MAG: hypothetical protein BMS9Abin23_0644 [Thermodesulfobacteriota bacterium]
MDLTTSQAQATRNPAPRASERKSAGYPSAKFRKSASNLAVCLALVFLTLAVVPINSAHGADESEEDFSWKTHIELSFASTNGNTDTQSISGKFEFKKEGPRNRYFFNGTVLRTENLGTETSNRITLDSRIERPLTARTFALFSGGYLRDKFSGYELRLFAGPGLGAELIPGKKHHLQALLNFLYYHDEFTTGDNGTDDYVNSTVSAKYRWKIRENLRFNETLDFSMSLKDRKRYFIDSVSSLDIKVGGPVSMGVSYTVNYQHSPPSSEIKHTDTTFLTSLIIDL